MKALVCSTLLLMAVPVLAVGDANGTDAKEKEFVQVAGDAGAWVMSNAAGSGEVVIKMVAGGDSSEGPNVVKTSHVIAQVHVNDDGRENRGWLGVYLGEVSAKEAEENGIDGGVRILNIIKDSPAEAAGLERGDIVASINGQSIVDGLSGLSNAIGELEPGSEARIGVIRDRQTLELTATLGKPQSGKIQLLHALDVDFVDSFKFNPNVWHFLKSGDENTLVIDENFAWQQLPESLRGLANLNTQFDVRFGDGERMLNIKTVDDGEVLDISQDGDGPITVKRYTEGNMAGAEEAEYADADALKAADVEAFELYDQQSSRSVFMIRANEGDGANFTFGFEADKMGSLHADLLSRLGAELKAAHGPQGATGQLHKALIELHGGHGGDGHTPHSLFIASGKAAQSFRVNPDGEIEVTIRKGDTEIVNVYSDQADLEARNPEAFEKYRSVLDSVNE